MARVLATVTETIDGAVARHYREGLERAARRRVLSLLLAAGRTSVAANVASPEEIAAWIKVESELEWQIKTGRSLP